MIAWIIIPDLSMLGGSFGSVVTHWIQRASIDPQNEGGFICFLKLLLTGAFITIFLIIFKKKITGGYTMNKVVVAILVIVLWLFAIAITSVVIEDEKHHYRKPCHTHHGSLRVR